MARTTRSPGDSLLGRTLGRFTVVELLSSGGSGDVYRADQLQLGRSVVIKVLAPEIADAPNRIDRFLREARLASRLDHPYAAHVYAFGVEPDEVLWIAMEHVNGSTLDELVERRGPMPASVFAPFFMRLCEVVHSAHELGIVHRDIKGLNVMVLERAGQLLPKLLDFGIAKDGTHVVSPGSDSAELTGHGSVLGSPHYMAPEQWTDPANVDARADIYALGVLAYRCLTGALPFGHVERSRLARAHAEDPVAPLPISVPGALADVVYRALAKRREERWSSATALGRAIERSCGAPSVESLPAIGATTRDVWLRRGPQPIADAIADLVAAKTTLELDAALRMTVGVTSRWLAIIALASAQRERLHEIAAPIVGDADAESWAELAATYAGDEPLLSAAASSGALATLAALAAATRDERRTPVGLAADLDELDSVLRQLEPLLAYRLVATCNGRSETRHGERGDREQVVLWNEPLREGEVALVDAEHRVALRLSPFVQLQAPLPGADAEVFVLWHVEAGCARLVSVPAGFERDDAALAELLVDERDDTAASPSPYRGLAAYGPEDGDVFVGREREIELLVNRLVRVPMVAVLGPSGVGKSSLIHAGLVPRLRAHHHVITLRPGREPTRALAAALVVTPQPAAIAERIRDLAERSARGLVIVIDQLEELSTLCDDDERRAFAELIVAATTSRVRVVATLRADFATVIESEAALRGRFDVFVLGPPSEDTLERILVEPPRRAGVRVDRLVIEDMIGEVSGRPGSLPLLAFTAERLWQSRDREARRVSYAAYRSLGGVKGALSVYAEQVFDSLHGDDQRTARELFMRLVAPDGTRIPMPRSELEQMSRGVLANLIESRLLVVRDDAGPDSVELAHECLAEQWPRLVRWRNEDAIERALLADLGAAARRWQATGRPRDRLWRGSVLEQAVSVAQRTAALTDSERSFIAESERATRRARSLRRLVTAAAFATLTAVALVLGYCGVVAENSRARATRSEQVAEQRLTDSLIAQGRRELADARAFHALAFFEAALRRGADSVALRTMIGFAGRSLGDIIVTDRTSTIMSLAASPAGWFAVCDRTDAVRVWSAAGKVTKTIDTKLGWLRRAEHVRADDTLLVFGELGILHVTHDGTEKLRIATQQPPWHVRFGPGPDEITTVELGSIVVYGRDGKLRRKIGIPNNPDAMDAAFDSTGGHVLLRSDKELLLYDVRAGTHQVIARDAPGYPIAGSNGTLFAFLEADTKVRVITPAGELVHAFELDDSVTHVGITEDDHIVIGAGRELTVYDQKGKRQHGYPVEGFDHVYVMRGDDAWIVTPTGVVRRYVKGALVASMPALTGDALEVKLAGDVLALVGSDSSFVLMRARSTQLVEDEAPCKDSTYTAFGPATSYVCGDQMMFYIGRVRIGEYPFVDGSISVGYDAAARRAAVVGSSGVRVFVDGKLVASDRKEGSVAVAGEHVWLAEHRRALWRWTPADGTWLRVRPLTASVGAVAVVRPDRIVLGTDDGDVIVADGLRTIAHMTLGDRIDDIAMSADHRWLAAQMSNGAAAIIDTERWAVVHTLPAVTTWGASATFDPTGELLMRAGSDSASIWDRAGGEELVSDLDLLDGAGNAIYTADGAIAIAHPNPAALLIEPERRPVPLLLGELACHVPLQVVDGRIRTRKPVDCPGVPVP